MSSQKNVCAVFPGSFDPITNGHLDVIHRSANIFQELIIAVGDSSEKNYLFNSNQRLTLIKELIKDMDNVTVESYDGLTVEYVKQKQAHVMVRALRNLTDVQYEFQLALTNRSVSGIETVFIMTGEQHAFTSSSLIREIARFQGDVSSLVPENVNHEIKKIFHQ